MTYKALVKLALAMPNVEEGTSYGTPALKVKKKFFIRLRAEENGTVIVLRIPSEAREALMAEAPEKFFITDHYKDYPAVLVRLPKVTEAEMRDLLKVGYKSVGGR
jgi:hypothetical protein